MTQTAVPTPPRIGRCPTPAGGAVAIIASAGGIEALRALLAELPTDFPWPLLVTQHLPRDLRSDLPALLQSWTSLRVRWATEGDRLEPGYVYVARPHQQIEVTAAGLAFTTRGLPASSWLASTDLLLTSVAREFGEGAVGIVLSGMLAAGVKGLRATIAAGGVALVQSAGSAAYAAMPIAAADLAAADWRASPQQIGVALAALAEYRSLPPAA